MTPEAKSPYKPSTRVFVSGHSLTDQPLPDYLENIASSLGTPVDWERQYMAGSAIKHRARGQAHETGWAGYSMGDNRHGQGLDVVQELRTTPYDVLLITEQHGVIDSLVWYDPVRHLRHYHDVFQAGHAGGRTYFFEPWLGIPGRVELDRWIDYERQASALWHCIVDRVNQGLADESRADRITALPAATALAELMSLASTGGVPGLPTADRAALVRRVFKDDVHLTPTGTYFMALVAYVHVFGRAVDGAWAPDHMEPLLASSLQQVATRVVSRPDRFKPESSAVLSASLMRGDFLRTYLAHRRDEFWAVRPGPWPRRTWSRLKTQWTLRWRLRTRDPFAWGEREAGYWFPAP